MRACSLFVAWCLIILLFFKMIKIFIVCFKNGGLVFNWDIVQITKNVFCIEIKWFTPVCYTTLEWTIFYWCALNFLLFFVIEITSDMLAPIYLIIIKVYNFWIPIAVKSSPVRRLSNAFRSNCSFCTILSNMQALIILNFMSTCIWQISWRYSWKEQLFHLTTSTAVQFRKFIRNATIKLGRWSKIIINTNLLYLIKVTSISIFIAPPGCITTTLSLCGYNQKLQEHVYLWEMH